MKFWKNVIMPYSVRVCVTLFISLWYGPAFYSYSMNWRSAMKSALKQRSVLRHYWPGRLLWRSWCQHTMYIDSSFDCTHNILLKVWHLHIFDFTLNPMDSRMLRHLGRNTSKGPIRVWQQLPIYFLNHHLNHFYLSVFNVKVPAKKHSSVTTSIYHMVQSSFHLMFPLITVGFHTFQMCCHQQAR